MPMNFFFLRQGISKDRTTGAKLHSGAGCQVGKAQNESDLEQTRGCTCIISHRIRPTAGLCGMCLSVRAYVFLLTWLGFMFLLCREHLLKDLFFWPRTVCLQG